MTDNKQCTYPNCDSCNDIFSIPACMLMDAGIDLDDDIIIIPYWDAPTNWSKFKVSNYHIITCQGRSKFV